VTALVVTLIIEVLYYGHPQAFTIHKIDRLGDPASLKFLQGEGLRDPIRHRRRLMLSDNCCQVVVLPRIIGSKLCIMSHEYSSLKPDLVATLPHGRGPSV
jgi:hypothetical protein